jgi:DnaK suppressor protein
MSQARDLHYLQTTIFNEGTAMLTKPDILAFQKSLSTLLKKRRELALNLAQETQAELHARGTHTLPDRPERQADPRTDEVEQEIDLALLENADITVHEIEAALERIKLGSFGMCSVCNRPISKERLTALPSTRYCIRCARLT